MKIYIRHEPAYLVRLQICKAGSDTQYLTLYSTTPEQVFDMLKKIVEEKNISPFLRDKRTSVNVREAKGGKNGKSTSLSFVGITPVEMMKLIIKYIKDNYDQSPESITLTQNDVALIQTYLKTKWDDDMGARKLLNLLNQKIAS